LTAHTHIIPVHGFHNLEHPKIRPIHIPKFFLTTKMQIQRRDGCSLTIPGNSSYCDKVNYPAEVLQTFGRHSKEVTSLPGAILSRSLKRIAIGDILSSLGQQLQRWRQKEQRSISDICRIKSMCCNHVVEPSEWQRIDFETRSGWLNWSINRLSMSLHVLMSCVRQVEGLAKANFNNSNQAERVGLTCQANGDKSHRGRVSNRTRKYQVPLLAALMRIRCMYDMRIWAENLTPGSCKAYFAALLLYRVRFLAMVAGISRGKQRIRMYICELPVYTIRVDPKASLWRVARL
jgi:hypothetical protein